MKITDCYWEKANIGCTTTEIVVEDGDQYNEQFFIDIVSQFDYVVIKVPMKMSSYNFGLSRLGYTMTEVQCKLSKEYRDFDFEDRFIQRLMPHVSFEKVQDDKKFNSLVNGLTPGMFSTDRISLDPYFGLDVACRRYKNWMTSFYNNDKAEFLCLKYDNKDVGFSMYEQSGDKVEMILGGIFEEYQSHGLGIITPTRHLLYAKQTGERIKKVSTTISSNNSPVWKIYNHFNFKIDGLFYVFVKHKE